jgi:uncharacterized protein (TIGR02271 family)
MARKKVVTADVDDVVVVEAPDADARIDVTVAPAVRARGQTSAVEVSEDDAEDAEVSEDDTEDAEDAEDDTEEEENEGEARKSGRPPFLAIAAALLAVVALALILRRRRSSGDGVTGTGAVDIRVPVVEEQLVVEKRQTELGQVHLHKEVTEEQRTVSVPVSREEVTVERVPLDMPVDAASAPDAFAGTEVEMTMQRETPVVDKKVRAVEEVRLHKDVVNEQQQVSDTVRKERVVVEGIDEQGQERPPAPR